jgi:hypothetical protein
VSEAASVVCRAPLPAAAQLCRLDQQQHDCVSDLHVWHSQLARGPGAAAQRVRKRYLAVALGRPHLDAWTEDGPIDFHPTTKYGMHHDMRASMAVCPDQLCLMHIGQHGVVLVHACGGATLKA